MAVEAVPAAGIPDAEPALLDLARRHLARLPVDALDVLLVDRMGKDISGVGMDTNVIGRTMIAGEPDPPAPRIGMIACHELTPASHGNATGMGLADVVTRRFADAIDHEVTRTNVVTSGFLLRGKLPVVADDDRQAWAFCLRGAGVVDPAAVRAARIVDTLRCRDLWVTDAVLADLAARAERGGAGPRPRPPRPGRPADAVRRVVIDLLVGADDRTGALEAAGGCADAGTGAVWVGSAAVAATGIGRRGRSGQPAPGARRRRPGGRRALDAVGHRAAAHKIDSLLRGNWAHELVARARAGGRRVLLVPALPAAGRTCAGGVVHDGDRPVADRSTDGSTDGDARSAVASSRPADHLRARRRAGGGRAGRAGVVGGVAGGGDGPPFAVCDAATEADLAAAAAAWAGRPDVLLAGTAATVAAAGAVAGPGARDGTRRRSAGGVAAAVGATVAVGPAGARRVRQPPRHGPPPGRPPRGPGRGRGRAGRVPRAGGGRPRRRAAGGGGDPRAVSTGRCRPPRPRRRRPSWRRRPGSWWPAPAWARSSWSGATPPPPCSGPTPLLVGGTLAPGTPWARPLDGAGPLVVTRAGSYGTRSSAGRAGVGQAGAVTDRRPADGDHDGRRVRRRPRDRAAMGGRRGAHRWRRGLRRRRWDCCRRRIPACVAR